MSDRSVVSFYYDYEIEHRIYGKRRVRGLVSREYGTAYLSELIPYAYNGIKFFLERCAHWDFDMGGSGYDALNAAFDTFFDEENIISGTDLVRYTLDRAGQNLYGHVSDEEIMEQLFGYDIFGAVYFTYTGSLKSGYKLKYGYADHGYDFMPMDLKSILDEYDIKRVRNRQAWDTVKPGQVIRNLQKLADESAHVEKLHSYQGPGGSFTIFATPEAGGKLYVISRTDENGNEFERAFNRGDLDFDDMDYPEFCAFMLSLGSRTDDLYELISDDYFVNAEGFDGIFDGGDRISLLAGFIDSYDGKNEELVRNARWGYSCAYDQCKMREMLDFFEQNAQLIKTKKGFFGVETKGFELITELMDRPKRKYEKITAGRKGAICNWERQRESDDDPIDKLYLSVLTYNCLIENGIRTLGELKAITFEHLDKMKNMPLRSKVEILGKFYHIDSRDGSIWKEG